MLNTNHSYLIHGIETIISWNCEEPAKRLFLWHKSSFWFWKNYTVIPSSGYITIVAKSPILHVSLRKLVGIRMIEIETIQVPVYPLRIRNLEENTISSDSLELKNDLVTFNLNSKTLIGDIKITSAQPNESLNGNCISESKLNISLSLNLDITDFEDRIEQTMNEK